MDLDDAASIDEQIEEVSREIAMRERLYPGWVRTGRMTLHGSLRQLRRLRAVLRTLQAVREASNEAAMGSGGGG